MSPDVIAAIIFSLGTMVVNKIWNRKKDSFEHRVVNGIVAAGSVITQIVLTTPPDKSVDYVIQQCKGAVAVQMGKLGLTSKMEHPFVKPLVDAAIAKGVELFVKTHPTPTSLTPPILAKVAKAREVAEARAKATVAALR